MCMNIDEILDMWKTDCELDPVNVGNHSLETVKLHSKYLRIFTTERLILKKLKQDYKQLQKLKYEYYNGSISEEDLIEKQWKPFQLKILKQDVNMYIDADNDIVKLSLKIGVQEEKVETLESIIKAINNRGFQIKNYIDFMRFTHGQ